MTAKNDVFQIVKRIVASDLFCCHDLRAGTKTSLKLLVALRLFCKAIALCQIHITRTIKGNIRGRRVFSTILEISQLSTANCAILIFNALAYYWRKQLWVWLVEQKL